MAKKSKHRETVGLSCKACKSRNYVTTRNKINMEGKLAIKKYCKGCREKTDHKETTSLK